MDKPYRATTHNLVKALDKAEVQFPITKKELFNKVASMEIGVGFDKKMLVTDYCKNISIDFFENKAQFFCALTASFLDLDKI